MSFRLKLFLFSALIGVLPLLLLGFYLFITAEENSQNRSFAELSLVNSLSNNMLSVWEEGAIALLESLAQRPHVASLVDELTAKGGDTPANELSQILKEMHFNPALTRQKNLNDLSVLDLSGKIIASTDTTLEGKLRGLDPYFIEGQEFTFIDQGFYSVSNNEVLIHVATPIRNSAGVTIAVLAGHLNWARASTLLSYTTANRTTLESYLVNRHHFILTASKLITDASRKVLVSSDGFQACLETGSGQGLYKNYNGTDVLGVYQWLPDRSFCLLTELALSELAPPLDRLKTTFYVAIFLLSGFAVFFAIFLANALSRPVRALVAGAAELGQGNLDHRFSETGGELELVQKALNEMADNLTKVLTSRDELNDEVEQRKQVELNLERAISDLKKSNQDLERFAYVASHDLQEPLRTITSYLQLLERRYRERLDSDALEFIDFIVDAAGRMKAQINDLLEYSRVGRKEADMIDLDLNQVIDQIIKQNKLLINETGALLHIEKLPTVKGVQSQFTLLFQNLISNAIKFHRKDVVPEISISAEELDDHLDIVIADNGIGIEEQYLDKIFIIFQRLHPTSEYPGTGIGLALCKRIVENHDGTISASSTYGAGSTFRIRFCHAD